MARAPRTDLAIRLILGAIGVTLLGYGVYRLLGNPGASHPPKLATWLVGAIVLHDFVLTPVVLGAGFVITRTIRPRARRYVQGALVASALVTAITIPMIYRRGKGLPGKALLERNYAANLLLVVALIGVVAALAYASRVARDRRAQRGNAANVRPSAVQTSGTP